MTALTFVSRIRPETVVSAERVKTGDGYTVKVVTVRDTLLKLRGRCKKSRRSSRNTR